MSSKVEGSIKEHISKPCLLLEIFVCYLEKLNFSLSGLTLVTIKDS